MWERGSRATKSIQGLLSVDREKPSTEQQMRSAGGDGVDVVLVGGGFVFRFALVEWY